VEVLYACGLDRKAAAARLGVSAEALRQREATIRDLYKTAGEDKGPLPEQ
jgi:hypothetical protein